MTGETGLQRKPRGWRWGGGQGKEKSERTRVRRVGTLVVGWENTSLSASDGSPPTAALFSCSPTGPQPDDRKVLSSVCLSEAAPPCSHGSSILSLPGRQPLPPFPLSLLLLSRLEGWFEVAPKYPIPDPNQPPSYGTSLPPSPPPPPPPHRTAPILLQRLPSQTPALGQRRSSARPTDRVRGPEEQILGGARPSGSECASAASHSTRRHVRVLLAHFPSSSSSPPHLEELK